MKFLQGRNWNRWFKFFFWSQENNYLGRGIKVDSNLNVSEDRIKGKFLVSNQIIKILTRILIYHLKLHPLIDLLHLVINPMLLDFQLEQVLSI